MKLWILSPRDDLPRNYDKNPWERIRVLTYTVIVRAEDEQSARRLAAAGENSWKHDPWFGDSQQPWINPDFSTCIEITADGPSCVIARETGGH